VFAGNTGGLATVAEQIVILKQQFGAEQLVFVGGRGMVRSKGKQALEQAGLRHISALTDPQIRTLLGSGVSPGWAPPGGPHANSWRPNQGATSGP
jgi:hypothetical protein